MSTSHQLRILSGLHAGARADLDCDSYTLGSHDDCDFVLADAGVLPHHARLQRSEAGWHIEWLAEGDSTAASQALLPLEDGKAVPLGPVVLTVDDARSLWPTLEQLVLVPHAPAPGARLPEPAPAAPRPARHLTVRAVGRRLRNGLAGAAMLGGLCLSGWVIAVWAKGQEAGPASRVALAPAGPDAAERNRVDQVLKQLGLGDRAKVLARGDQWQVQVVGLSDDEVESATRALAALHPRLELRLVPEQELHDNVVSALGNVEGQYAGHVSVKDEGRASFRLEGQVESDALRGKLAKELAVAVPQVRHWDNAVLTTQEAAAKLLEALQRSGWQIGSRLDRGTLQMEVTLPQRDLPQWEAALQDGLQKYSLPYTAKLNFTAAIGAAPSAAVASRLPFEIRGVIGGDVPYVMLADGQKLAPGGSFQGWRFAGLSGAGAVFESGGQATVVVR